MQLSLLGKKTLGRRVVDTHGRWVSVVNENMRQPTKTLAAFRTLDYPLLNVERVAFGDNYIHFRNPVSYTHLTLPTIYSV